MALLIGLRESQAKVGNVGYDWRAFGDWAKGIIGIVIATSSLSYRPIFWHVTYRHWVQPRAIGTPVFSVSLSKHKRRTSTWAPCNRVSNNG